MRALNRRQKKLLDTWYVANRHRVGLFFQVENCDFFSYELFQQLEEINDFETITQEINSYISDKAMSN
jgi:hypothetical protein